MASSKSVSMCGRFDDAHHILSAKDIRGFHSGGVLQLLFSFSFLFRSFLFHLCSFVFVSIFVSCLQCYVCGSCSRPWLRKVGFADADSTIAYAVETNGSKTQRVNGFVDVFCFKVVFAEMKMNRNLKE